MNRYIIALERELRVQFKISVLAEDAPEGVRIVNQVIRESGNVLIASSLSLGDLPPVEWIIPLDGIDEDVSIIKDAAPPLAKDMLTAYRFLEAAGYNYQGEDGEDALAADDAPLFIKPIWTEDGAGSDSFLQVRATYESESGVYQFQIEAILYPTGRGDIEKGEAPFRVRFQDKQYFMSATELPMAIEVYETLFTEFIKVLRSASDRSSI